MEDFITTEYNFELQQLEKQIDQQQKSSSVFGEGEMIQTRPPQAVDRRTTSEQNLQQEEAPRLRERRRRRQKGRRETTKYN